MSTLTLKPWGRFLLSGLFGLLFLTALLINAQPVKAFTPSYDPNNLIDNPTLLNNTTMSASTIQTFLSNIGGGIASYSDVEACDSTIAPYYTHCGQTISAAQIIFDASQAYGINPRAILATMEKEQSLVTDPSPSSSQINCAMGFNSCTNYVGFFTQIDNGTWALRYNYEGAMKHATWDTWSPGSNYPCSHADTTTNLYNNGLYPGNVVTFADPGGTAETITIANAATATLYCYTPYVGPYSQTGYSGSYNFVYYYQLWFGSTQASVPYAWTLDSAGSYLDSKDTVPFSMANHRINIAPNGTAYVVVKARNVGYQNWTPDVVRLGTTNPIGRCSTFYDSATWMNCGRVVMQEASVAPGDVATYSYALKAPSALGTYKECMSLVADGIAWLNDPGFCYWIDVVNPQTANTTFQNTLLSNQSLSDGQYLMDQAAHSVLAVQHDGNLVLTSDFQQRWSSNTKGNTGDELLMQPDGNLVLYTSSMKAIWNSATVNNPGAYAILQNDGNLVVYSSTNSPLWSSGTNDTQNHLNYVDHSADTSFIYPMQQMQMANGNYKMLFQPDGNLVIYTPSHAIWSTQTNGTGAAIVALQADGNLVVYTKDMKAVWNSATWTQGVSHLDMQDDGNLVLYNSSGVATWNSGTNGKQ